MMIRLLKNIYSLIVKKIYSSGFDYKDGFLFCIVSLFIISYIISLVGGFFSINFWDMFLSSILLFFANCLALHELLCDVIINEKHNIIIRLKSKDEIIKTRTIGVYFFLGILLVMGNHYFQCTIFNIGAFGKIITQLIILKNLIFLGLYLSIYSIYIRTKKTDETERSNSYFSIPIVILLTFFYLKGVAKYEFGQNKLGAFLENDNYTAIYKINANNLKNGKMYKDIKSKINVSLETRVESQVVNEFDGRTHTTEMEDVDVIVKMISLDKIYLPSQDTIYFDDSEIKLNKATNCRDINGNYWQIYLINEKVADN